MDMHIYIIWGFLGSGKTTLINYLLSSYLSGKKVVVIENESGTESVDSVLLRSKNYQVKDLNSGCICCTLRQELPIAIKEIEISVRPDILLIEPSGLASLEDLVRIPDIRIDGIISLVDVHMYAFLKKLNFDFYRRQFYLSSVILLTKTSEAEEAKIRSVINDLLMIQPRLEIVQDYHLLNEVDWGFILSKSCCYGVNNYIPAYSKVLGPNYEIWTISVYSFLSISFYERLFNRINKRFPNGIVRAKGFVLESNGQWGKIDYVNGKVHFETVFGSCTDRNNGFISIWWDKSLIDCPIDWISGFINAKEVDCSIEILEIENNELYRYLGFGASGPDDYMSVFVENLKREALDVCSPRFGYRFVRGERVDRRTLKLNENILSPDVIIVNCLRDSEFFAIITASVGKELDEWIEVKRSGGDVMEAFVADALGSVIVEAIVTWGLSFLTHMMAEINLKVSNSYSPGYCGWDVAEQRMFFSMLPDGFCGISLTDSCLMLPIKSVSALVGIGGNIEKKPYGCAICRKKDCFKRKEVMS